MMEILNEYRKPAPLPATDAPPATVPQETRGGEAARLPTIPLKQQELLTETLKQHGYKPTPENMEMLMKMLDGGVPLTKENITHMHQAMKMTGNNLERALFMLQNSIPVTPKNTALLNGLAEGQTKITQQIDNLLNSINNLQDPTLRATLTQLLSKPLQNATGQTAVPGGEQNAAEQNSKLPSGTAPPAENTPQTTTANAGTQANNTTTQTTVPQQPSAATPQTAPQATQTATGQPQAPVTTPQANQQAATATPAPSVPAEASAKPGESTANVANSANPQPLTNSPGLPNAPQTAAQPALQQAASQPSTPATAVPTATPGEAVQDFTNLRENLSFRLENSTVQDVERFLNGLREAIAQAQTELARHPGNADTARVMQSLQSLSENIDFASQLRNQIFIPLPIMIDQQAYNSALYVGKNNKNNRKGKKSENSSALIALDTAAIGHFETYVQKYDRGIHCQFRLESDRIEKLVRANIHKLETLLREYRYNLDSFTFLVGGEPFSLVKTLEDEGKAIQRSDTVFDTQV